MRTGFKVSVAIFAISTLAQVASAQSIFLLNVGPTGGGGKATESTKAPASATPDSNANAPSGGGGSFANQAHAKTSGAGATSAGSATSGRHGH